MHPAGSRVALLAGETPASFIAFDLLALGDDDFTAWPFASAAPRWSRRWRAPRRPCT